MYTETSDRLIHRSGLVDQSLRLSFEKIHSFELGGETRRGFGGGRGYRICAYTYEIGSTNGVNVAY